MRRALQVQLTFHFQMATASAAGLRRRIAVLPLCSLAEAVIIYKTWGPASQTTIKVLDWRPAGGSVSWTVN